MFRNTDNGYGLVQIVIHWIMAGLIIWTAIIGLRMTDLPDDFSKLETYAFHKSLGLTVLLLAVVRLVWKLANKKPLLPATMVGWERKAAMATHHAIYLLLFLVPTLGWLTSDSAPFPLQYFGLIGVPVAGIGADVAKVFLDIHEWVAKLLLLLVIMHVAAALKHHFISEDDVLRRMIVPAKD